MHSHKVETRLSLRSQAGMSLIELIVAMALMAIIAAMAVPTYQTWRQNLEYRTVARSIAVYLKETRSQAITTNVAQPMNFDFTNKKYSVVNAGWQTYPAEVSVVSGTATTLTITFNTNGTADADQIVEVKDSAGLVRYTVNVTRTGRVSITP